ncbi:MAG: alpha/beta fold hydrolase [Bryobacterales bacterium]|nr:alpha/beta fold hydrolase [Bryobacterales bacterium]MBV9401841.1 alpha/beta fold hydrolase [Bryobacterales bacterium]
MKRFASVLAVSLIATISLSAQVQKKDVDIKAADGVTLKGTYYSPGHSGPAMILLHQCNMDRHAWDGLAQDLANAGFNVLTVDFRGFGQSGGDKAQRDKWPGDVDAAYAYLLSQKDVDKSRLAAGGASCGVTQSSDLAARHHEIKALMLLSGNTTDATRAYITATTSLPVFGAASEGDTGAAKGIKEAVSASNNPKSTVKIYSGTEHGVPMFAKNPELEPMIVTWLKTQVAGKTGS